MLKMRDISDPGSAVVRQVGFDESSRKTVITASQPNEQECLSFNRALFNAERTTSALCPGDAMVLVARVPLILIEKWRREEGLDYFNPAHQPRLLARFNSNEYSALRTAPGRL
jgi:hypothetical protein